MFQVQRGHLFDTLLLLPYLQQTLLGHLLEERSDLLVGALLHLDTFRDLGLHVLRIERTRQQWQCYFLPVQL
uniref:Putative secreted protein n=1 Tax=Anopheles darlingi TaxID=43151 RepID=A0A2M4DK60_ANODA